MKDRVNFLASRQAGQDMRKRLRQTLLGIAVLGIAALAAWFGTLQVEGNQVRKETLALETRVSGLKDILVLNATLERKQEALVERRDSLRRMMEPHTGFEDAMAGGSDLLADLAEALPPGVWLARLQVMPSAGSWENGSGPATGDRRRSRLRVTLFGKTVSQEQLLDFLGHMEANPRWAVATLRKMNRERNESVERADLFHFEILLVPALWEPTV